MSKWIHISCFFFLLQILETKEFPRAFQLFGSKPPLQSSTPLFFRLLMIFIAAGVYGSPSSINRAYPKLKLCKADVDNNFVLHYYAACDVEITPLFNVSFLFWSARFLQYLACLPEALPAQKLKVALHSNIAIFSFVQLLPRIRCLVGAEQIVAWGGFSARDKSLDRTLSGLPSQSTIHRSKSDRVHSDPVQASETTQNEPLAWDDTNSIFVSYSLCSTAQKDL